MVVVTKGCVFRCGKGVGGGAGQKRREGGGRWGREWEGIVGFYEEGGTANSCHRILVGLPQKSNKIFRIECWLSALFSVCFLISCTFQPDFLDGRFANILVVLHSTWCWSTSPEKIKMNPGSYTFQRGTRPAE